MIATRSCHSPTNADRVREYRQRVTFNPDFNHLAEAGRIARGVKKQAELIRLPIPRHRALVVVSEDP